MPSHSLGDGPIIVELYLDYCCPFSKKMFDRLYADILTNEDRLRTASVKWIFRHQIQPWHAQSSWLHEAAIAVGKIDASKFWQFSSALFTRQRSFFDEMIINKTRTEIMDELATIAESVGVPKSQVLEALKIEPTNDPEKAKNAGSSVCNDLKFYIKLGRQNGVHVSPSVLVNGLLDNEFSSSWTAEQWSAKLDKLLADSRM